MHLEVIELRRGAEEDRYRWEPFDHDDGFTEDWWHGRVPMIDDPWFVSARLDGEVVARVELCDAADFDCYDTGSLLAAGGVEVVFLEVSTARRGQGIATRLIREIATMYPERQLVALSEEADDFWTFLGWHRVDRVEDSMHYRPLFIGPRLP